jgi:hypothetical protein
MQYLKSLLVKVGKRAARSISQIFPFTAVIVLASFSHITEAQAARCSSDSKGNWTCSYQQRDDSFNKNNGAGSCTGSSTKRHVRWQVPEGTPPSGGWPVAFYYNGTVSATSALVNPFVATKSASYGFIYLPQIIHELLDDPAGTGKKYAVIAAEAPNNFGTEYWDTNGFSSYTSTGDYCFLPDLFSEVAGGSYGAASQYNMSKRYAFGISSGGYNTSRMAVTFNGNNTWKALAIVSASYATCSGSNCSIPNTLPSNHPPTKFWHGTSDYTVPISTMRAYYNKLVAQGIQTEKVEGSWGHQFTAQDLGSSGVQNWFNRH